MTGWQLLGFVLFAGPILTLLFWGLFFHAAETWALIWRSLVCAAVACVLIVGFLLLVGDLP